MPSTSEDTALDHASPNPLGDAAASEDQVGLAVRSVATAIAFEIACLSVIAWGTAAISRAAGVTSKEQLSPSDPQVNLIIIGTLAALFAGGGIIWVLLAPVRSNFRRGGVAIVGGIIGLLVGLGTSFLANVFGGPVGLVVLAVAGIGGTLWAWRATQRTAQALPSSHHA